MRKGIFGAYSRVAATMMVVAGATSVSAGLVTLDLLTDNFASETSFEMVATPSGSVFAPNESVSLSSATEYAFTWDLSPGNYEFTIFDSFGDGICCGFGLGSYSVTTPTETFSRDGNFGSQESIAFAIDSHDVPVPASGALIALGALCLAWARRRFRAAA